MSQQYPEQPQYQPPQTTTGWQPQQQYPQQEQWQQQPFQQPPPMYPQRPPKKKSRRGLWIALGAVAVVVLAACIGVSAIVSNGAKSVQTSVNTTLTTVATTGATTTSVSTPATQNSHHKIGEVVTTGSTWQVTVTSVKLDRTGDQFTQPKAGNVFIVIHTIVKNTSGQSELLSSLGNFTFRDTNGNTYTGEIGMGDKYTAPDGTVQAGEQIQGDLVYQVPTATKKYNLYFQENAYNGTPVEWDIQV